MGSSKLKQFASTPECTLQVALCRNMLFFSVHKYFGTPSKKRHYTVGS